ncbi:MAG: formylglycine-generating enzyme family protein [Alphaproteobacteria bacterium]|nr:MAG: formylglycine-generating enzyme family protein [Alphaproteobacteria bacterium]
MVSFQRLIAGCGVAVVLLAAPSARAQEFTNHLGIVTIPAGTFFMGSCNLNSAQVEENRRRAFLGQALLAPACPSGAALDADAGDAETPETRVTIAQAFQLAKTEVTLGQFKRFLVVRGDLVTNDFMQRNSRGDQAPVVNVSWQDAQAFIAWLNQTKGPNDRGRYRLPSEAEWEYAARAGTTTRYSWGNQVSPSNARYHPSDGPAPVASYQANAWGLFDMHGNVWEWVEDCWHGSYAGHPGTGGVRPSGNCRLRVVRGGSWFNFPVILRSASRFDFPPGVRGDVIGFRVARTPAP